eukprot:GHVR01133505.1.p1 GENE.GHVR01133505.1~~GHVR01133505.1.p1  ORF type:complete len:161 (+),score=12.14 GHVR01133505.1:229-711(+)
MLMECALCAATMHAPSKCETPMPPRTSIDELSSDTHIRLNESAPLPLHPRDETLAQPCSQPRSVLPGNADSCIARCGPLTPSTAFGILLVERLRARGMRIEARKLPDGHVSSLGGSGISQPKNTQRRRSTGWFSNVLAMEEVDTPYVFFSDLNRSKLIVK